MLAEGGLWAFCLARSEQCAIWAPLRERRTCRKCLFLPCYGTLRQEVLSFFSIHLKAMIISPTHPRGNCPYVPDWWATVVFFFFFFLHMIFIFSVLIMIISTCCLRELMSEQYAHVKKYIYQKGTLAFYELMTLCSICSTFTELLCKLMCYVHTHTYTHTLCDDNPALFNNKNVF